mgnify:CR=1 FL=1
MAGLYRNRNQAGKVTVLCPVEGQSQVKEVAASGEPKENEIVIRFTDESTVAFREEELIASIESV